VLSRSMVAALVVAAVAGFGTAYVIGHGARTTQKGAATTALPTLGAAGAGPTLATVGDAATLPALRRRPHRRPRPTPTTPTPTTTTQPPPPTTTVQPTTPPTRTTKPKPPPPTITEE
jgi:hypothetical protein